MIITALIAVVVNVIGPFLNSFLPKLTLGSIPTIAQTVLNRMGGFLKFLTPIFPASVVIGWMTVWSVVLLAAGAYRVFEWVWAHIPEVAGFGTGNA